MVLAHEARPLRRGASKPSDVMGSRRVRRAMRCSSFARSIPRHSTRILTRWPFRTCPRTVRSMRSIAELASLVRVGVLGGHAVAGVTTKRPGRPRPGRGGRDLSGPLRLHPRLRGTRLRHPAAATSGSARDGRGSNQSGHLVSRNTDGGTVTSLADPPTLGPPLGVR